VFHITKPQISRSAIESERAKLYASFVGLAGEDTTHCGFDAPGGSFPNLRRMGLRQSRRFVSWPTALLFVKPRPAYIRPRRGPLHDRGDKPSAERARAGPGLSSPALARRVRWDERTTRRGNQKNGQEAGPQTQAAAPAVPQHSEQCRKTNKPALDNSAGD
jgi:hypothetical protein